MEPTIVGAALSVVGMVATAWLGHRKGKARQRAEVDGLTASVAKAAQDVYGELIADMRNQVAAAAGEAQSARNASREALRQAQAAEELAWKAERALLAMQRFLTELRPVIETYVPESAAWLARLDKLAGTSARQTNPVGGGDHG